MIVPMDWDWDWDWDWGWDWDCDWDWDWGWEKWGGLTGASVWHVNAKTPFSVNVCTMCVQYSIDT